MRSIDPTLCSCCGSKIDQAIYNKQESYGYTEGAMCIECLNWSSENVIDTFIEQLRKQNALSKEKLEKFKNKDLGDQIIFTLECLKTGAVETTINTSALRKTLTVIV